MQLAERISRVLVGRQASRSAPQPPGIRSSPRHNVRLLIPRGKQGIAPAHSWPFKTGTRSSIPALCRFFSSAADQPTQPLTALSADRKQLKDAVRKFAEEVRVYKHPSSEASKARSLLSDSAPVCGLRRSAQSIRWRCASPFKLDSYSTFLVYMDARQRKLRLSAAGFMGMAAATAEGGSGMSFSDSLLVVEELARVDPSVGLLVGVHNSLVVRAVDLEGTEEQKKAYLPKLCSDTVGSFCLSESGSGSDAFSLGCLATRDEERKGWVIKGSKQWISNAEEAGLFLVFATVDPEKEHKGICCFLVDAKTEGLSLGRKCDKLGIRASSTCEVKLENVFVPDDRLLGRVGEGYKLAARLLNESRISTAALMLGLAQGAFDLAIPFLNDREQFGHKLADFQGVRFQAAELSVEMESARLLVLNAAALKTAGLPFVKEAAMAKYKAAKVAELVASQCVDFFGGRGYTREFPLEKFYRDAKIGALYEGTSNMQLETIFKAIAKEYE
ncbi:hypothetical protein Efla_000381 [Eimeria flavescens]